MSVGTADLLTSESLASSLSFVRTPCRVPDIGRYLDIPAEWSALDTHHPGVPPLFIVHAQVNRLVCCAWHLWLTKTSHAYP
jgi:hypothetical protein